MSDTAGQDTDLVPAADAEVSRWLYEIGFSQYAAVFNAKGITLKYLTQLTDEDLQDLGVTKLVHRATLLFEINKLRHGSMESGKEPLATVTRSIASEESSSHFPGLNAVPLKPTSIARIPTAPPAAAATPPRRGGYWARFGGKFLIVSILAHLLFAVGAAYYVVQTIYGKHKLTFHAGPPSPNPSQRAIEHKVQMAKKQNTMSAPALSKRIVTTGFAKVALPEMPSMPSTPSTTSTTMAGVGIAGLGPSLGVMGAGNSGGGGGMVTMFGLRSAKSDGIIGTFYDLKQTGDRQPIPGTALLKFNEVVNQFISGGWNLDLLNKYYKSPNNVRMDQLFIPTISDLLGPACFGEEKNCQPLCWLVHYQGNVVAPESFRFRFVGGADDWVFVRFNNTTVLAGGWPFKSDGGIGPFKGTFRNDGYYNLAGYETIPRGYARSFPIEVNKGETYTVEILFGEAEPVNMAAALLIEIEGTTYQKDANGSPILPLFRTTGDPLPPPPAGTQYPPHDENAPIWKPAPPTMGGFGSPLFH